MLKGREKDQGQEKSLLLTFPCLGNTTTAFMVISGYHLPSQHCFNEAHTRNYGLP
jgi:hypothetical protein